MVTSSFMKYIVVWANFILYWHSRRGILLSTTVTLIMTLYSLIKAGTKTFVEATSYFQSPNWNISSVAKYSTHFLSDSDKIFTYSSNQTLAATILVHSLSRTVIPKVSLTNCNNEWWSLQQYYLNMTKHYIILVVYYGATLATFKPKLKQIKKFASKRILIF